MAEIPQPTQADLERDAAKDYDHWTELKKLYPYWFPVGCLGYIRRAVAAESALAAERQARIEAEAGAEVMRAALEVSIGNINHGEPKSPEDRQAYGIEAIIKGALASDAGRSLLARLEAAEKVCEWVDGGEHGFTLSSLRLLVEAWREAKGRP